MLERELTKKFESVQESFKVSEEKLRFSEELSEDLKSKVSSLETTVTEKGAAFEEISRKNELHLSKIDELELLIAQKHQELEESAKNNQIMQDKLESIESTLSKGKFYFQNFHFISTLFR
jgi:ParB-like chromosome segregation protein Spo0J